MLLFVLLNSSFLQEHHHSEVVNKLKVQEYDVTFTPNLQVITKREVKHLPIGAKAHDFNLPGVDGKFHKLSDY